MLPLVPRPLWALNMHLLNGKILSANPMATKLQIIHLVQAFFSHKELRSMLWKDCCSQVSLFRHIDKLHSIIIFKSEGPHRKSLENNVFLPGKL